MPKCPGLAKSNEGRWDDSFWNPIHKLSFEHTKSQAMPMLWQISVYRANRDLCQEAWTQI